MIKLTEEDHDEVMFLKESYGIHAAKKMVLKKKVLSKIDNLKRYRNSYPEYSHNSELKLWAAMNDIGNILETILEEF